ncbi:MAG TPA: hypothetical protein VMT20_16185 [Terriglobia bacterium]|nr:hypothetical protein [Terriglobia bacterium]
MSSNKYIMDLHSETVQACVVNDTGNVVLESTMATETSADL